MNDAPRPSSLPVPLAILLLVCVPFAAYWPALTGEFVVDDHRFIVRNEANLDLLGEQPWRFFTDPSTNSTPPDGDIYRPLRTLSFAVDQYAFGLEPLAFHLHNLLLHAGVAVLAFFLSRGGLRDDLLALLGALLLAVHPLATEAVAWISSRADLQAALLALAALLAARRAERGGGALPLVGCFVLAALAGLGKETAVVVPALYLVDRAWRRFGAPPSDGDSGRPTRPFLALTAGSLAYLTIYLTVRDRGITGQVDFYEGSWLSHLPYGLVGLGRQLRLAIWPSDQTYDYATALFQPITSGDLAAAGALVLSALVLAIASWRCCRGVACGIGWYFVALLPAANLVLPLRTVLAERFAYLPLVGVAIAVTAAAAGLSRTRVSRAVVPILAIGIVAAATATFLRAGDWSTRERLHRASLESYPDSYAATLGLAAALEEIGSNEEAAALFERARRLGRDDPPLAIRAAFGLGRRRMLDGDYGEAIRVFQWIDDALTREPTLIERVDEAANARFFLGYCHTRRLDLDAAAAVFDQLIAIHGERAEWYDARGEVERARLSAAAAIGFYEKAIDVDSDFHKARIHLALVLKEIPGLEPAAETQLLEVLGRDPDHAEAAALLEELRGR